MISLDDRQLDAARSTARYTLVSAGPGTGKTRTLLGRLEFLLDRAEGPVALLTFSRRAAADIVLKIEAGSLFPSGGYGESRSGDGRLLSFPRVATIHALAYRIVSDDARARGETPPAVVDDDERENALRRARMLCRTGARSSSPGDCYRRLLADRGRIDFDGILDRACRVLENDDSAHFSFRHVLIDEFQDVSFRQLKLIRLLIADEGALFAIGDADQSVYSFRGASVDIFRNFSEYFPQARVFFLDKAYRTPGPILSPALKLIEENRNRKPGGLLEAFVDSGEPPRLFLAPDAATEAAMVVSEIASIVGGTGMEDDLEYSSHRAQEEVDGIAFSDVAVLYRLQSVGDTIARAFEKEGLPYRRRGGRGWLDHIEVKRLLCCLEAAIDPGCDKAFSRMMSLPVRGLSLKSRSTVEELAEEHGLSLNEALRRVLGLGLLSSGQGRRAGELLAFRDRLEKEMKSLPVRRLFDVVCEWLPPGSGDRLADEAASYLYDQVVFYQSQGLSPAAQVARLVGETSLIRQGEWLDANADAVTLTTFHSSKGLEFPVVFICGLEKGIVPFIPGKAGGDSGTECSEDDFNSTLEEERRLLYVAMTRASLRLYLSMAQRRNGPTEVSPFLAALPSSLLEPGGGSAAEKLAQRAIRRRRRIEKKKKEPRQLKLF